MTRTAWLLAATALLAAPASAATLADRYSSFWVLGDSLSDNGNLSRWATPFVSGPKSGTAGTNAYWDSGSTWSPDLRFSNGAVWTETVAAAFRAEGMETGNYAYGGAQAAPDGLWDSIDPTPELAWQRTTLVSKKRSAFGASPLVSIVAGANDLFAGLDSGGWADAAAGAARAVGDTARYLSGNGVSDLIIGTLPDLSLTPRFALFQPDKTAAARAATDALNVALRTEITGLRTAGLSVTVLDLATIIRQFRDDPAAYGFSDVTRPCWYPSSGAAAAQGEGQRCTAAASRTRLFFDEVHPNQLAHRLVGEAVVAQLTADPAPAPVLVAEMPATTEPALPAPVPLPPAGLLLAGGVLALAWGRRRSPVSAASGP